MSQNFKIPFKNHFLLTSLQSTAKATSKGFNYLEGIDKKVQESDESTQQSLCYSLGEQSCNRNATQLSYSIENSQHIELTSATADAGQAQYIVFYHNESQMNSLLTYEPDRNSKDHLQDKVERIGLTAESSNQQKDKEETSNIQGNTEQKFDYSQELLSLKDKIIEIQSIAQLEIIRLKQQLAHQKQLRQRIQKSKSTQTKEVGVNTEKDLRDEEIEVLKISILNHIDLNKKLLQKQANKASISQMQNLMSKVKI